MFQADYEFLLLVCLNYLELYSFLLDVLTNRYQNKVQE